MNRVMLEVKVTNPYILVVIGAIFFMYDMTVYALIFWNMSNGSINYLVYTLYIYLLVAKHTVVSQYDL